MGKERKGSTGGGPRGPALSERDRYWLGHVRACDQSGSTASEYARRHDLSIGALYEAKRRLVKRGMWPVTRERARTASQPRFIPVAIPAPEAPGASPGLCLRLADGTTLEWSSSPAAEILTAVLAAARIRR